MLSAPPVAPGHRPHGESRIGGDSLNGHVRSGYLSSNGCRSGHGPAAALLVGAAFVLPFLSGCATERDAEHRGAAGLAAPVRPGAALSGAALSGAALPDAVGASRRADRLDPMRGHGETILGGDLVLRLRSASGRNAVFSDLGVTPIDVLDDGVTWRVEVLPGVSPSLVISAANSDARVESVESNILITLPESAQSSMAFSEGNATVGDFWDQGLYERLGLRLAHSISNGAGIRVAVLDTGVNPDHPIFNGRVATDGFDFVDHDAEPLDLPDGIDNDADGIMDEAAGHGCHVAGLVTLVAPGATILPIRVLNSDGSGTAYNVARGIEYAVNHGARVINMSLSMSMSANVVNQAIGYAVSKGVILVCAAGNVDQNGGVSPLNYPANDGRVWAVGALTSEGTPASFSAPGPGVAFSAPGERLLSAYWNDGFATWTGTSMASPLVAGTAALFLSLNRWDTPERVRAQLEAATSPIAGDYSLVGAGQVHAGQTMAYLASGGNTGLGNSELKRRGGR